MKQSHFFQDLNKTETRKRVQEIVDQVEYRQEFTSDFIGELIRQHHYYCSRVGIKPVKFRKTPRQSGKYNFEGYFEGRGWHKVSWNKSISPPNLKSWLKDSMRDLIQPLMFEYKSVHKVCQSCGKYPSQEVDHVEPEFDEIAKKAIQILSQNNLEVAFSHFDFWETEKFKLPKDSPAVALFLSEHRSAKLMAVCKECHVANARSRNKTKK